MLPPVSEAMCIPQSRVVSPPIRFDDRPEITKFEAGGNLRPIGNKCARGKTTFPWGHPFEVDEMAVNDAALVGTCWLVLFPIVFWE